MQLENDLEKYEILKNETPDFVEQHFKNNKEKANESKIKEIEEIEKKYLLYFEAADTFKAQLKAEVGLEVSKKISNQNLLDQLRNSGLVLNEDKWKSVTNETHEQISKLKATIETLQSIKSRASDFLLDTVDLNPVNLQKNLDLVDLNNNLQASSFINDNFIPNLDGGRASQNLNIFDHYENSNGMITDDKTNEDTDVSSISSENIQSIFTSKIKFGYSQVSDFFKKDSNSYNFNII